MAMLKTKVPYDAAVFVSKSKLKDIMLRVLGPTVQLQAIEYAGVKGARVITREGGRLEVHAQVMGGYAPMSEAVMSVIDTRWAHLMARNEVWR